MTVKAAVLGHPISHSLSPRLHGHWLAVYGIDGGYEAIDTPPERLAETLRRLQAEGYAGCNLTVPLKEQVMPLLDQIDPVAEAIGAVNTVAFREGRAIGYNTDAYGFMRNLEDGAGRSGNEYRLKNCIVLGAGGAARAVIAGLLGAGAERIVILNRSQEKAEALAADFSGKRAKIETLPWQQRDIALAGADLLVNATSLGMRGQPPLEIALEALPLHALVTDIVYAPLETELLRRARLRGNLAIGGLGMLLYQAQPAFELFYGTKPEVTEALREAVLAE